jgi:hypothetical protein
VRRSGGAIEYDSRQAGLGAPELSASLLPPKLRQAIWPVRSLSTYVIMVDIHDGE